MNEQNCSINTPLSDGYHFGLEMSLDRHEQGTCVSTEGGVPLFLFITWEIKVKKIFTSIIPLFCSYYRLRGTQQ